MTLKVTCKARSAGGRSSSKCGERDEMDGQPERARMRDAVESMEPVEAVRHRQGEALGARPRAGRIESIISSCGLDAIRDSRIACRDGFRDTPCSRSASEVRSRGVSTEITSLA
jgi:hypothetical protein